MNTETDRINLDPQLVITKDSLIRSQVNEITPSALKQIKDAVNPPVLNESHKHLLKKIFDSYIDSSPELNEVIDINDIAFLLDIDYELEDYIETLREEERDNQ